MSPQCRKWVCEPFMRSPARPLTIFHMISVPGVEMYLPPVNQANGIRWHFYFSTSTSNKTETSSYFQNSCTPIGLLHSFVAPYYPLIVETDVVKRRVACIDISVHSDEIKKFLSPSYRRFPLTKRSYDQMDCMMARPVLTSGEEAWVVGCGPNWRTERWLVPNICVVSGLEKRPIWTIMSVGEIPWTEMIIWRRRTSAEQALTCYTIATVAASCISLSFSTVHYVVLPPVIITADSRCLYSTIHFLCVETSPSLYSMIMKCTMQADDWIKRDDVRFEQPSSAYLLEYVLKSTRKIVRKLVQSSMVSYIQCGTLCW